jgi:hypothetical protein
MGRLGVEATSHLEAMRLMAKVAMQAHRASLSSLPRSLLRAHSPSQVLCSCEHTTASYSKNIYGQSLATHKQALFAAGSANFISNIFCSIYVRTVAPSIFRTLHIVRNFWIIFIVLSSKLLGTASMYIIQKQHSTFWTFEETS